MAHFIPINANLCKNHGWKPYKGYAFAAKDSIVPIVAEEVPHVLAQLPIAMRKIPDKGVYELVAVMSFRENLNFLVHPDGSWMGGYLPGAYRGYPFWSFPDKDSAQMIVCIDMDSGVYTEQPGPDDSLFFDDKGQMTPSLSKVTQFLNTFENKRRVTWHITGVLAQLGLIVPWEIKVMDQGVIPLKIEGICKVDEKALKRLSTKNLDRLRKAGALSVAYGQLFSQHRFSNLTKLYDIHKGLLKEAPELDIEKMFGDEDVFRFND